MHPLFLNMITLGGSTQAKVDASRSAGFAEIELWREDVEAFDGGAPALRDTLRDASIGLTDIQVLRDFDGAPLGCRDERRREALTMMDLAQQLGAKVVQAPASTDPAMDRSRVVEDLRWLATNARLRGLSIAYEPMAWSVMNHDLPSAWRTLQEVDEPNIALVVDAFHIFARDRTVADLVGIPPDRIANVQLCDLGRPIGSRDVSEVGRHCRLLPGAGYFPLRLLLDTVREAGYQGPIGVEVFNDQLKTRPPAEVAEEAMAILDATLKV